MLGIKLLNVNIEMCLVPPIIVAAMYVCDPLPGSVSALKKFLHQLKYFIYPVIGWCVIITLIYVYIYFLVCHGAFSGSIKST